MFDQAPSAVVDAIDLPLEPAERQNSTGKIFVVLPAFNEQQALPALFANLSAAMRELRCAYEVIVVDDGSADGTAFVASQASYNYPVSLISHEQNQGLAAALRTGLERAVSVADPDDIIFTMDADNTQPAGLMPRMRSMILEGHDVVIASRFQRGARVIGVPLYRDLLSRASGVIFRVTLPIRGVRDYTCGFRAYRASILAEAMREYGPKFVSEKGFSCMVDVLLKLRGRGLLMGEVPMILRYDHKAGDSKMRVIRTMRQTLSLIVRRRMGR